MTLESGSNQDGAATPFDGVERVADVVLPTQSARLVLPQGTSLDDLAVEGRDLVVTLQDGSRIIVPDGAIAIPEIVVDGVVIPPQTIAQLLAGNEPEPAAGPLQSSGGNFAEDEGAIQDAFEIGDLLPFTDFAFPDEIDEEIFPNPPEEDEEPEVVIETIDNPVGVENAIASVDEDGLPERGSAPIEPAGSQSETDSESTSGSIVFEANDGLASILINGAELTEAGQAFVTDLGVLSITGIDLVTGRVDFTYSLTDNIIGEGTDPFAVTIVDVDGDTAAATLNVLIDDDGPIAADDLALVPAGTFGPVDGDVLINDVPGADGFAPDGAVQEFANDNGSAAAGETLQGVYGTLTLNGDGTYTYVRDFNTPGGVEESFEYTIVDADGTTSTAILTIQIGDAPDEITSVPTIGDGTLVNEGGLPPRGDESVGSNEIADGDPDNNSDPSETTTGVIEFSSPDGVGSVTIGGVEIDSANLPQTIFDNNTGFLTVTDFDFDLETGEGTISFEFTLVDNTDGDDSSIDIDVVVVDLDGDVASDTVEIAVVDDSPAAVDDANTIAAGEFGPAIGNVLDNDTQGADGAAVTGFAGAGGSAPAGETVAGEFGTLTLNADGSYSYTRIQDTPGGVSDTFSYTITDGDGDDARAELVIDIADAPVNLDIPVAGEDGTLVDEAGLGGPPAGSTAATDAELTSGTFEFSTPDGLGSVTIGGAAVTAPGQTFTGSFGTLTINAIDAGSISYTYELTSATNGDDTFDAFDLVVTDLDGDEAAGTLTIEIVDDVPSANPDVDSVSEDGPTEADGNVLTGVGGNDANATDGSADGTGADGAEVTGVAFGASTDPVAGNVGTQLPGTYGSIAIGADGSYSYILDNSNELVQGLDDTESLTEIFTYTITDGDGDQSTTTITITINGSDDPVVITGLDGAGAEETLFEDDLADGSSPDPAELVQSGSFSISSLDGLANLTVGGVSVFDAGTTATFPVTIDNPAFGLLTITGIATTTDANGDVVAATVSYSYTLQGNSLDHSGASDGSFTDSFAVIATDTNGSTDTQSLDIEIVDDAPLANDDGAVQAAENQSFEIDALANDVFGADEVDTSDITNVFVSTQAQQGTVSYNPTTGLFTFTPAPGAGSNGNVSDFFEYTIVDGDGDFATARVDITLQPDSEPDSEDSGALLDDDGLAGGNPVSTLGDLDANSGDDPANLSEASYAGTLRFFVGNDTPANAAFGAGVNGSTATIGQETVIYSVTGSVLTATVQGGNRDGLDLFTVEITNVATGEFVASLLNNVIHDAGNDENDASADIDILVTDGDLDTTSLTLSVTFDDDTPTASDNLNSVDEGASVSGNVLTDDDGTGLDAAGADGFATPRAIIEVASASSGTTQSSVDGAGNLVISSALGTLTVSSETGDYIYQSNADSTNVDAVDEFTYTIIDADGDIATAMLTIDVANAPGVVSDNDVLVNEAGLAIGSAPLTDSEIDADGQISVVGATGTLTYTLLSPAEGTFGSLVLDSATGAYTYSLDTPFTDTVDENGTNVVSGAESFDYEVRDSNGNLNGTGSISVSIIDDVPTATDQTEIAVAENAVGTVGGNVTTDETPDTSGADGATVTEITVGETTTDVPQDGSNVSVITANGTYTIDQNGNWTFDPSPGLDQSAGNIDASFSYTLTDGDGDFDTAVQPIIITDGADPEAGPDILLELDDQNLVNGSDPAADDFDSDTIEFTPGSDAIASIVFGDTSDLEGGLIWTRVSDTQVTGEDGGRIVVTLDLIVTGNIATVTATLNDNFDDHPIANSDDTVDLGDIEVVATDTDNDSASATVSVTVSDDLPAVSVEAPANGVLTVDETDFGTDASADFSTLFTTSFNADNPGTPISFALGITAGPLDLVDTATGENIELSMNAGVVEGRTENSDLLVFSVSVDAASGLVTLDQQRAIEHANALDPNDPATIALADLITLTGTIVDSDGDAASDTVGIANAITFLDDGPALSNVELGSSVSVDETDGFPTSATSAASIVSFVADFGADGGSGADFSLSITNASSGLVTSDGQFSILLQQTTDTLVTGVFSDGASDQDAFTVELNSDGTVTLTQLVALEHADGTDPNDALDLNGSITAIVTITDGDLDAVSAPVQIGGALTFFDDGPAVALTNADVDLLVTEGVGNSITQDLSGSFDFDGGADGPDSVSFALAVSADGVDSGIVVGSSTAPLSVFLFLENGEVVGRSGVDATAAATGDVIFTVEVDEATGEVTLTSNAAINHNLSNGNEAVASILLDDAVQLVGTVTDNDSDSVSATQNIGNDLLLADTTPDAAPDTDAVLEGGTVQSIVGVLGNDTPSLDQPLTVIGVDAGDLGVAVSGNIGTDIQGQFGTLTLNGDGSYEYVSAPNSVSPPGAQDVFTYTLIDADGDVSTSTLTINIADVSLQGNDVSVLVDEAALDLIADGDDLAPGTVTGTAPASTAETVDGQVTVSGTGVTYTILGSTTGTFGVISIDSNTGEFTYTLTAPVQTLPNADDGVTIEAGDSFTYSATDSSGNTTTGTIFVNVIDDAPIATVDGEIATVDDNASGVVVGTFNGLTANDDFGADGQGTPAITIAVGSLGGTVTIDGGGNLIYTSATDVAGPAFADVIETFSYTITDGDGDTATAMFQIRLTDEGPAIDADAASATVDEDGLSGGIAGNGDDGGDIAGEATVQMGNLSGLDFGVDGPGDISLTAVVDTGLVSLAGNAVETVFDLGTRTLTGQDSVTGDDVFTLVITDLATGAYTFTLLAPLDHPATDTEDDLSLSVEVVVSDAEGETATGTFNITIDDDSPAATDDTNALSEDSASVSGNVVTDPVGDAFGADGAGSPQVSAVTGAGGVAGVVNGTTSGAFGALTLNDDGSYTYNLDTAAVQGLDDGETEIETFTYTIIDADGDTSDATLTITINGANDAPIAVADTNFTIEDAPSAITGNVLQNVDHSGAPDGNPRADAADTDVDGETLSVATVGTFDGAYGILTLNSDGSYEYRLFTEAENPTAFASVQALDEGDAPLSDVFNYTASDGDLSSNSTLTIDIFGTNDAPIVGTAIVATSDEGLQGGLPDMDGSSDTTDLSTANGSISITDVDDSAFTVTLGIPIQSILVADGSANGAAVDWELSQDGQTLTGTINGGSQTALVVTIDNNGDFTVTQSLPIFHTDSSVEDTAFFTVDVSVDDGTTSTLQSDAITVNLEDDSPLAAISAAGLSLAHDETPDTDGDAQDVAGAIAAFAAVTNTGDDPDVAGSVIGFAEDLTGLVSTGSAVGGDGGTVLFSIDVAAAGVDSGLNATEGSDILLFKEGELVVGRVADQAGEAAFAIAVDASIGAVSLAQYLSIEHPNGGLVSPDESVSIVSTAITAIVTTTDADGDSSTATTDIGNLISFQDDAGTLGTFQPDTQVIGNVVGATAGGTFAFDAGADGHDIFDIVGPALDGVVYQPLFHGLVDATDDGVDNATVEGTLLTATNSDGSETLFTLAVDVDGNYNFTLVTPDAGETQTVSLLNLSPGGPTPFVETPDFLIELTGSGNGVNSSNQGFGINNQFVGNGQEFSIEFHSVGTPGDDAPLTDPDFVSSLTLINDNINGSLDITVTVFNDATGESEVLGPIAVTGTETLIDPVNLDTFNRVEVVGTGGNGQGVRFVSLDFTKTILPQDFDLDFAVNAVDGDGDITSTSTLNVMVDASSTTSTANPITTTAVASNVVALTSLDSSESQTNTRTTEAALVAAFAGSVVAEPSGNLLFDASFQIPGLLSSEPINFQDGGFASIVESAEELDGVASEGQLGAAEAAQATIVLDGSLATDEPAETEFAVQAQPSEEAPIGYFDTSVSLIEQSGSDGVASTTVDLAMESLMALQSSDQPVSDLPEAGRTEPELGENPESVFAEISEQVELETLIEGFESDGADVNQLATVSGSVGASLLDQSINSMMQPVTSKTTLDGQADEAAALVAVI